MPPACQGILFDFEFDYMLSVGEQTAFKIFICSPINVSPDRDCLSHHADEGRWFVAVEYSNCFDRKMRGPKRSLSRSTTLQGTHRMSRNHQSCGGHFCAFGHTGAS
jgi:hypothetical protein